MRRQKPHQAGKRNRKSASKPVAKRVPEQKSLSSFALQDWNEPINPFQRVLLEFYPGRDFLRFDPQDAEAALVGAFTDTTGDTLFTFLWRELAARGPNVHPVLKSLDMALADIQAVKAGLAQRFGRENSN